MDNGFATLDMQILSIINSKVYNMGRTSATLSYNTTRQLTIIQYESVLIENIPQLALQLAITKYITGTYSDLAVVVYIAITLSVLDILSAIMGVLFALQSPMQAPNDLEMPLIHSYPTCGSTDAIKMLSATEARTLVTQNQFFERLIRKHGIHSHIRRHGETITLESQIMSDDEKDYRMRNTTVSANIW